MKRYYNLTTHEWYIEGTSIKRNLDNGVFTGVPTVEQLTEWGFEEYIEPTPTPEQILNKAKQEKLNALDNYDDSYEVNGFIIRTSDGDVIKWLDTLKRNNALRAVDSAKKLGLTSIETYIEDIFISLTIEEAEVYLAQIEMYAVSCANITNNHRQEISNLQTVEEVNNYDFTTGYPAKLIFNI